MAYNEIAQRGSPDFPVDYFYLDEAHSKYNMAAHWHSEIELLRVLEGEFEATLNNNSYILKKMNEGVFKKVLFGLVFKQGKGNIKVVFLMRMIQ